MWELARANGLVDSRRGVRSISIQELARAGLRNPVRVTVRDKEAAKSLAEGKASSKIPSTLTVKYAMLEADEKVRHGGISRKGGLLKYSHQSLFSKKGAKAFEYTNKILSINQ